MEQKKLPSSRVRLVAFLLGAAFFLSLLFVTGNPSSLRSLAEAAQPPVPHPVEGRSQCLACHGPSGALPAPKNHASYNETICLSCHKAAPAAPKPTEAAASATPTPTAQSSPTEAPSPTAPAAPLTETPAAPASATPTGTPVPTATPTETPQPPATATAAPTPPAGAVLPSEGVRACLSCHTNPDLATKLANGEMLSLYVNPDAYAHSVHGQKLVCTDCHRGDYTLPHTLDKATTRREYALGQYETCKECHFANYTKTLDSVHYQALEKGNQGAPVCTDCHSSHSITPLEVSGSKISQACAQCHKGIYDQYAQSVHGEALLNNGNSDVPVCTTCHGVHNIQSASTVSFKLSSPELCASCHSDEKLMARYGISAQVMQTYLDDFHGKTVGFYQREGVQVWKGVAVCTDCHGIHNIQEVKDNPVPSLKTNLLATCQKCHPDATTNFPDAWLSHYEPSPSKASLVYYVRMYYWILIPLMVGGLTAHVLLDLWRVARNR